MDQVSNEYLRNAVLTATPEQLQLMLYDGAIRFARQGIEGLRTRKYDLAFEGFSRAQKIVLEMLNGLNYEVDPDLCKQMAGLYNFIYRKLVEASTKRAPELAEDALKILEYQRETWLMLMEKLRADSATKEAQPEVSDQDANLDAVYGTLCVEG